MLSPARRRELGAFYTPPDVADRLVAIALDGLTGEPTVCDPSCGDGVFLLAAGRAIEARGLPPEHIARDLLWGCDVDREAVAATRAAITAWSGVDPADHLRVGDGLTLATTTWRSRFDVVTGNPPFLNQLERATVRRAALPASLDALAGPYTDTAWLFLVAALELGRPGGRVVLVQPQSLVAARDAAPVRGAIEASLEGVWWCDEPLFDASVRVCAPVLGRARGSIRRWTGRDVRPITPVDWPQPTWSALVPSNTPLATPGRLATATVLGSMATATAGFRDEYYGLTDHVIDDADADLPKLITSGLIDVGRVLWGEQVTRFGGRRFLHPRVQVHELDGSVARWVRQRLVPKVVLATQTKVLEAAVDVRGEWIPSTPVIAVHAAPADLWRVASVLTAPAMSAWALRHHAGAALHADAIKLSARQVLDLPLPAGDDEWAGAARALEAGRIIDAAFAMDRAYGAGDEVLEWWRGRLPSPVPAY
jgi:predicted RNA methylase